MFKKIIGVSSALLLSTSVYAASNLPDSFNTDMEQVATDIKTVGAAIIGLAVISLAIRWVKATFF